MQNIIYLTIHILFALGLFVSFKLVDIRKLNIFYTIQVNYAVAIILSIIDMDMPVSEIPISYSSRLALPSFMIGLLFAFNFVLMMFSTKKVGLGLTAALNKMSVVIPATAGILYLGQNAFCSLKVAGIAIALVSFVLILYPRGKKVPFYAYLLPAGVFIISGVIDTSMEMTQRFIIGSPKEQELFLFGVFITAFILSVISSRVEKSINKVRIGFSYETIFVGMMIGLFNYLTSKMVLINVASMGGSVVFPIHNASVVMLTALIGYFWFKEKFSGKQWTGIALAVVSVAIIASTLSN